MAGNCADARSLPDGPRALRRSTSFLTLAVCDRSATRTASPVATTTTSLRPMTAANCSSERTSTFDESMATARPRRLLPLASRGLKPPDRRPLADVRPADVGRQHHRPVGSLHHRIVDRGLRRLGEGLMVEDDEAEVLFRSRHRRRGRGRDLGLETLKLLQHDVGAEDEIARVPEIAVFDERARVRFVGLLHESLDPPHLGIERQRRARMNVAVAGRRMVGRDAEGDDFARHRPPRRPARKAWRIAFRPRTHGRRRARRRPSSDRAQPPRRPPRRRRRRCRAGPARAGSSPRRRSPSIARRRESDSRNW